MENPWPWWTIVAFIVLLVGLAWFRRARNASDDDVEQNLRNLNARDEILSQVAAGSLPVLAVSIGLQPEETCHLRELAEMAILEKAGQPRTLRGERGTLYLTNQRVVFSGPAANETFPWSRVMRVVPSDDGLQLDVRGHRPVIFSTQTPSAGLLAMHLAGQANEFTPLE